MNTKTLGLIGILCSPFLAIDFIVNGIFDKYEPSSLSGLFSLIYMTGWLGCIAALYYNNAAGYKRSGKVILIIQMSLLSVAEIWNVYAIIQPKADTVIFHVLDMFWPISNCFMLVTGLSIIFGKALTGWKRYVPFAVSLWLPVSILVTIIFGKDQVITILSSSIYSAIAWLFLGLTVYLSAGKKIIIKTREDHSYKPV